MSASSKAKRRDPRASRGSSARKSAGRRPDRRAAASAQRGARKSKSKSERSQDKELPVALTSEDAAELEALTAPLRQYRAQAGPARHVQGEPLAESRAVADRESSAADSGSSEVDARAAASGRRGSRTGARADEPGVVQREGRRSSKGAVGERGRRDGERERAADGGGRSRRRPDARAADGGEMRRPGPARTSLAQKGGQITTRGDAAVAAQLAAALAAADSDETQDLTHGFHTYPARMHPRLARELIARFSEPGDVVLDPFCGSGTVLVEALVAGRKPQGVDLNPLALRISEVHCSLRDARARRRFQRLLRQVADASEERVRSRARAHIPIDRELQAFYQPHVLFELSGLREEIEAVPDEVDRRALLIVFSALLIKFSRKRADTSGDVVDKRIRKGLVTEFFERKGQELCMRWEALFEEAPDDAFEARLLCGDARDLPRLLGPSFQADLILSSPPYGGTYDYARQHELRNAWFGFDTERLQEREIGARRALSRAPSGVARWNDELLDTLRALREVAADAGDIILWLGDAEIAGLRIPADEQVAELAPDAALTLKASAAQPRFDARGGAERFEHLLLLEPQPLPRSRR